MVNLSKMKCECMLAFLDIIREEQRDDEEVLIAIGEIENELLLSAGRFFNNLRGL